MPSFQSRIAWRAKRVRFASSMRSSLGCQSGLSAIRGAPLPGLRHYNWRTSALARKAVSTPNGRDAVAPFNSQSSPLVPDRRILGTRFDAVRRGRGRRRPGGTRRGDPAEAARRGEARRARRVRDRERLGDRGAYSLGRSDGPARARRALPRLEGPGRPAQYALERGPVPVSYRIRLVQGAGLSAAGVLPQRWQLRDQPG